MNKQSQFLRTMVGFAAVAVIVTVAFASARLAAQQPLPQQPDQQPGVQQQAQQPAQQPGDQPRVRVGTFDPQAVFTQYPGGREFINQMQEFEQQAMQAQQQGDQQGFIRVQTEAQQAQQQALSQFERVVTQALPEVAQEAGVDLIAVQISYSAPHVEVADLTANLVEKIQANGDEPAQPELPQPIFPEIGR